MRYLPNSYSIPLFILGAYVISWPIWFSGGHFDGAFHIDVLGWVIDVPRRVVPSLLGNIGPGLAATVIVGLTRGWTGICQLWSKLKYPRLNTFWILFVFFLVPSLFSLALLGYWFTGGKIVTAGNPIRWLLLVMVNLPFAPLWEEIGWRGFLLPRLETRYSGLLASMLLACVWGPWHVPLYWNSSFEYFAWFLIMIFALAVIFTWVYNRCRGNLAAVVVLHSMVNATSLYLLGPTIRSYGIGPLRFVVGFLLCTAFLVVLFEGSSLGRNSLPGLVTDL